LILLATPRRGDHRKGDLFVLYQIMGVEGKVLKQNTKSITTIKCNAIERYGNYLDDIFLLNKVACNFEYC